MPNDLPKAGVTPLAARATRRDRGTGRSSSTAEKEDAMTEQSTQWQELADRVEALALKLKMHVEQTSDDAEVKAALGRLRAAVDSAFDAAGNAVHDDAVRADIREVGRLLSDAMTTTFARVGSQVRDLFERRG